MREKVVIDAGHGGRDPGAVFEGRQEKDDALALALAVGELLEAAGLDVAYTRTEDVYNTPYEKAMMGNHSGADYFVSIHRNASAEPGTASGIETLVYEKGGEAETLAKKIGEGLEELGFANRGVIERPNLVVLRRTNMPAVLVEAGFIDSPEDNERFDEQFDRIAKAIADGILDMTEGGVESQEGPHRMLYQVQTGAFREVRYAEKMLGELQTWGYPAWIRAENGWFQVRVGAYEELDHAISMERQLRKRGYNTYIAVD